MDIEEGEIFKEGGYDIFVSYVVCMEDFKKNKLFFIIVCRGVIVLCVIFLWVTFNKNDDDYIEIENLVSDFNTDNNESESDDVEVNMIYIHITGEVNNPGVLEIEEGSRIKDVIEMAGGLTDMADIENVNLAYQVSDGQKIKIPNKNDNVNNTEESDDAIIVDSADNQNKKININTANQSELELINRNWTIYCG